MDDKLFNFEFLNQINFYQLLVLLSCPKLMLFASDPSFYNEFIYYILQQ
jgi:hypothetical protein